MSTRTIEKIIQGVPTSDGAGVKLIRSVGRHQSLRVDPFLMLDAFSSDEAADYIGGFPLHPHRGFETVTYMLEGRMRHEDHMGNRGELGPGSVQWMTAGRGMIHSEMPEQTEGRMQGFQLWLNLPAAEKMKPAAYRDIAAEDIPRHALANGGEVKVIAGQPLIEGERLQGPINGRGIEMPTDPLYLDVHLPAHAAFELPVAAGHNCFMFLYAGSAQIGKDALPMNNAAVLSDGDALRIEAEEQGAYFLLLAAKPLNEPVAQYGPFVMNTMEEVEQAIQDYQAGTLTQA